jgi:RHS repeat-associated protein
LPVKITKFSNMPDDITLEMVNADEQFNDVDTVIEIAYDNDGERLWYSVNDYLNGEKWTNIYLPGLGIFHSKNDNVEIPVYELIKKELVAGGYKDVSEKIWYPVADAQGNVRGYVTDAGLESAYDYYPYGNAVEIVVKDGDDNKGWQGKYFDAEHGKLYFGSRYFDPFFGMWLSPDPASQFANPYTYGGDPINFVDPNGEEIATGVVVTAAIVGAIIGGSSAAYQCSKYGSGSCAVSIPQGTIVGAAAGAAGAYVGGVAAGAAVGAGEGSIVGGMAGGATSSATSYIGNSLFTGEFDLGEGLYATMTGAFSGAITGGVGSSLELSGTAFGWAGRVGGEILGNTAGAAFMTMANGESWRDLGGNILQSVGMGLASSILTGYIDRKVNASNRYDGTDILKAGLKEGDIIAWGYDGGDGAILKDKLISGGIMLLSGEPYSHIGIVEKIGNDLYIREANGNSADEQIFLDPNRGDNIDLNKDREFRISKYRNRPFKIVARNVPSTSSYADQRYSKIQPPPPNSEGKAKPNYNVFIRNCASQASQWTGSAYRNNPGAFVRSFVGNGSIYYNSISLQRHVLW